MTANSATSTTNHSAIMATRLRRNTCQPLGGDPVQRSTTASGMKLDAFVEERVKHVHDEVKEHYERGIDDHGAGQHKGVAVLNGIDEHHAHTGNIKDRFDNE